MSEYNERFADLEAAKKTLPEFPGDDDDPLLRIEDILQKYGHGEFSQSVYDDLADVKNRRMRIRLQMQATEIVAAEGILDMHLIVARGLAKWYLDEWRAEAEVMMHRDQG